MVSILEKKNTMREWLLHYFFQVCSITLVLTGLVLCFSLYMNQKFTRSTRQLLTLNDLYLYMDDMQDFMYEYTWYGDEEDFQEMQLMLEKERAAAEELLGLNITTAFYRDILDIRNMISEYQRHVEGIRKIKQEADDGAQEDVLTENYRYTSDIYSAVSAQAKSLYSQLLAYIRTCEEGWQRNNRICLFLFLLLLAEVVYLEVCGANRVSEKILGPIHRLTEGAKNIACSNLAKIEADCVETAEEISLLIRVFNSMIERIEMQVQEIRERARDRELLQKQEIENIRMSNLLKTSQLKALQMQMNPHFLFNTLNMIAKTAYMDHSEQTVYLLEQTADLLRYSLDFTDKSVTLEKEIEVLGSYVCIQEQRFGKRIRFEFDLDESFHQIKLPSLVLQPLVENAIVHGIGMRDAGGIVRIITRYLPEEKKGIIEISDNGRGMSQEEVGQVIEQMRYKPEEKIGLSNVYARLQIFFNRQAEMEVESGVEKGTTIRIVLPDQRTEAESGDDHV